MLNPISHATQTQVVPQPTAARQPSPQAKTQPAPTDSVQLSKAALAARAVVQEASESQAQTAKEAASGDVQAKNLLVREAAEKTAGH